jgi:PAS domain S-box-containing protein
MNEMKLSRARLEALTDRSIDTIVATDRTGTVVYYNDGAKRSLGYSPDEILGTFVGRVYPSADEAKRVMSAMRSPDHGGEGIVESFRTIFIAKDGGEIPVAISGGIIRAEDGGEDGTVGYAKDLRGILRRDKLATLGEVALGLSHEINNPLAVVLNQTALLEDDIQRLAGEADSSVETERLDAIRREVARITEVVGRLEKMVASDSYETVAYVGPAKMIDLSERRELSGQVRGRMHGLRILVVDDDMGICRTLSEILEAAECEVDTAGDGEEALERIESGHFDLMLTDVVMPKMDGHELYLAVQEKHPELPVLMMTAFHYDRDHIIKRSRLKGLEGVIFKKPVDPQRLCQAIAEAVGR